MSTPVLIPSYNSDTRLRTVLNALPRTVSPVVLINGGETPENGQAISITKHFGAELRVYEERGKLPALQQYLGSIPVNEALSPTLLLDDDTVPIFPNAWHDTFLKIFLK